MNTMRCKPWLCALSLALVLSCTSPLQSGDATLTIALAQSEARAATISPETLAKLEYTLSCVGPGDRITATLRDGDAALTLVLRPGDWAVEVEARLPGGILVGQGGGTASLERNKQTYLPIKMTFSNTDLSSVTVFLEDEPYPAYPDPVGDGSTWSVTVNPSASATRIIVQAQAAVDGAELVVDGRNLGTGTVQVAIPIANAPTMAVPIITIAGADYTRRYTLIIAF